MQFDVLGPLEIRFPDGSVSRPSGSKQRLLLAALLVQPSRVVCPAAPAPRYAPQVSRLRALLGEAGDDAGAVHGEPHGYRLAVAPEAVDAGRFEAALRRSRQAPDRERELSRLDEALAAWRGEPYEELPEHPHFVGEITRLNELRSGARERRIDCLLALGRSDEAIAAAERLSHQEPLRERPRLRPCAEGGAPRLEGGSPPGTRVASGSVAPGSVHPPRSDEPYRSRSAPRSPG